MISGISAVAVRLIQVVKNGVKHIVAEPKGEAQTEFYKNSFFLVERGASPGRLFFVFESGEEVWGNTPEETLAHVNAYIKAKHH